MDAVTQSTYYADAAGLAWPQEKQYTFASSTRGKWPRSRSVFRKMQPECLEACLIDISPNLLSQLALATGRSLERRLPMPERAFAVSDAPQAHGGYVAVQWDRRIENAVGRYPVSV